MYSHRQRKQPWAEYHTGDGEAEVGRLNLTCASPAPDANVGLRQLTANRRHDQVCAWFEAGCGGISGGIDCRRARAETMIACCAVSIMRQRSDRLIR